MIEVVETQDKYKNGDVVNHPAHYADSCSLECIDVMEAMFGKENTHNYCLQNAFKYMWRWKNKNGREDLDKASWYANKAIELADGSGLSLESNIMRNRVIKLLDKVLKESQQQGCEESDL